MKFKGMKQAGFSLVELMVVVGIIGILAAIAVPKLQVFTAKAKQSEARTNLKMVDTYQQAYFAENSSFGTAATVGASGLKWKAYAATGWPTTDTGNNTYTVTATAASKLCPNATNTNNDTWTINEKSELSQTQNGLTGC